MVHLVAVMVCNTEFFVSGLTVGRYQVNYYEWAGSPGPALLGQLSPTKESEMVPKGIPDVVKARVVPLVYRQQLITDTTNNWFYKDIDAPDIAFWGPYLFSIIAHTNLVGATTHFEWKVVFYWSSDGKVWSSAADLFTFTSASGDVIQSACTATASFGLHMRYALAWRSNVAAAVESGTVSVAAVFNFLT